MLLNVDNGKQILAICSVHKIAYVWGLLVVLTLVLLVGAILTAPNEEQAYPPSEF